MLLLPGSVADDDRSGATADRDNGWMMGRRSLVGAFQVQISRGLEIQFRMRFHCFLFNVCGWTGGAPGRQAGSVVVNGNTIIRHHQIVENVGTRRRKGSGRK